MVSELHLCCFVFVMFFVACQTPPPPMQILRLYDTNPRRLPCVSKLSYLVHYPGIYQCIRRTPQGGTGVPVALPVSSLPAPLTRVFFFFLRRGTTAGFAP